MKYTHSLRNRIIFSFCLFAAFLTLIYSILIRSAFFTAEDMVLENMLQTEVDNYLERYKKDPSTPIPFSTYISSYHGTEKMPVFAKEMVLGLTEGIYETEGPLSISEPKEYHVSVTKMPDRDEYLYLLYNESAFSANERIEMTLSGILLAISLVVIGAGAIIGVLMVRKVIAPVRELAAHVAGSDPENLPVNLSGRFANDEIGLLARNLEESMQRIQAFVDREKHFTRDASHELRTPVTVIKGALELIQQLPVYQEQSLQRPLNRIERSIHGMTQTIETFLWLAREESKQDNKQTCNVLSEVKNSFNEHKALFSYKQIQSEFIEVASPVIAGPPSVFKIVVDNLLRNAFTYTKKGMIKVTVLQYSIEVYNTEMMVRGATKDELDKASTGFGFGLAIVERLCDRFGWQLTLKVQDNNATAVKLNFDK